MRKVTRLFFASLKHTLTLTSLLCVSAVAGFAQDVPSSRPAVDFEGSKFVSKQQVLEVANKCLDQYADAKAEKFSDVLEYCLHTVQNFVRSRGYLQAKFKEPRTEQVENGSKIIVPVEEGALYRIGEITVKENKVLSSAQLLEMINLKTGDIADGEALSTALFETIKQTYGNLGYIQYTAEVEPDFHLKGAPEGVVDLKITIDEGLQFRIRSIRFAGGDAQSIAELRHELLLRDGDVFNEELLKESVKRINSLHWFDAIDADKDVDYKVDNEGGQLDLMIHLKKTVPRALDSIES